MTRHFALWFMVLVAAGCGGEVEQGTPAPIDTPVKATGPGITTSTDGVEIAYTVHRIDDPNLVLVHGWMCDQSYWDEQVPVLAEGFGVVTIDLAGHGASGAEREVWSIESLADDVVAVLTAVDLERVIVAGHSMGGLVALDVARKQPERVMGILAIDTLHDAGADTDAAELEPMLGSFEQDFGGTCDGFVRAMFVDGTAPELIDRIAGDMCSGPAEIGAALMRAYAAFDQAAGFTQANVPIRAINVDLWPTNVGGNQQLADFDLVLMEGYGHFLMQEAPDELNLAMIDTTLTIVGGADSNQPTVK